MGNVLSDDRNSAAIRLDAGRNRTSDLAGRCDQSSCQDASGERQSGLDGFNHMLRLSSRNTLSHAFSGRGDGNLCIFRVLQVAFPVVERVCV